MSLTRSQLVDDFGQAMTDGTATVFVGAGLSMSAGMPSWGELLKDYQDRLGITNLMDMPLVAEYIVQDPRFGPIALSDHIRAELTKKPWAPADGHHSIARFPVTEVWTTNYDPLLELASQDADVVTNVVATDDQVETVGTSRRTVIKMHGSISGTTNDWDADSKPVISRTDYEMYENNHPRTWALLKASYFSRTFLFLGFSFTDPNIELMLRLARVSGLASKSRHFAVLTRPPIDEPHNRRLQELRVKDFERSGIRVYEIDEHDELTPLLASLVRRTRPPRLFISGSPGEHDKETIEPVCNALATNLVNEYDWELTSLGGPAGWFVTRDVARIRKSESSYDAAKLTFYFRTKNNPAPPLDERVGTAIYSEHDREELVGSILDNCRALIAVHGGDRTSQEIRWARERGIGVVPLAASGGAARADWQAVSDSGVIPELGGQPVDAAAWARLNDPDTTVASRAAVVLARQAMYESNS